MKNKNNGAKSPKVQGSDEAFLSWRKGQALNLASIAEDIKTEKKAVMPDIRGMSLRRAFQDLNGLDLHISIQGAGTIIRQSIKPGSKLKSGQNLVVELKTR